MRSRSAGFSSGRATLRRMTTDHWRKRYLPPIFALYETAEAVLDTADKERRALITAERELVESIRRKTFVMFEEKLPREGDPAADPSLAR